MSRIGSVGGSLLAGFGLGMFTALFGALVSPAHTTAAAFFVLLAVVSGALNAALEGTPEDDAEGSSADAA